MEAKIVLGVILIESLLAGFLALILAVPLLTALFGP